MDSNAIEVGRGVHFFAGYGGSDGDGLIVAVHGTPNHTPPVSVFRGIGRVIRSNDCRVDVILFDGRTMRGIHQCGIDAPGIGIKLQPKVHGQEAVETAKRNAAQFEADRIVAEAKALDDFARAEAARVIDNPPRFFWNGIKDETGAKLQRCHYSDMGARGSVSGKCPPHTITIYARDYNRFSAKVRACFEVENDTDIQVDYFESDRIRVIPTHPLYATVRAALEAQEAHSKKRIAKRCAQQVAA